MTAKNYFFVRRLTHTFAAVSFYHVRVESQVVVSLGASEFCLPLKVGAFWFTARDMFNPPIEKNVFESSIAYIYIYIYRAQELLTSQELHYAFSTHKLLFLQVSVDWNPNINNVMCPLEENVAVVADQSRLCRGFFHTACLFTVRRLK